MSADRARERGPAGSLKEGHPSLPAQAEHEARSRAHGDAAGPLVVLKFGGTSVGTARRVRLAARRIVAHVRRGRRVVVVVSAAGGATDRILARAARVSGGLAPASRELDRALATGEDRSASLLALAVESLGVPARSLRGGEAGLRAEGAHGAGRIEEVVAWGLFELLDAGVVPVVAGFQGVRGDGETVTLGRGASDATAVAVAAALGAECHLITDVSAVYDRDPNLDATARPYRRLDHAQLAALTAAGARVVQAEAARLAEITATPLWVYGWQAPLSGRGGTRIVAATAEEAA